MCELPYQANAPKPQASAYGERISPEAGAVSLARLMERPYYTCHTSILGVVCACNEHGCNLRFGGAP